MIVAAFTVLLYAIAGGLLLIAVRRGDGLALAASREAWQEFLHLLPRLAIGVLGAGYLAEIMPQETVSTWLGPDSGVTGTALATLAGALTPGGPVVGFALGAAALKAGAGLPQVMAFVTGWSLFTVQRVLVWEVPTMPARVVLLRLIVSLPFPFVVAVMAGLLPRAVSP